MPIDPLLRISSYEPVEKILETLMDRFTAAGIEGEAIEGGFRCAEFGR